MFVAFIGTECGLQDNFIFKEEDYEGYWNKIKRKKGRKWRID